MTFYGTTFESIVIKGLFCYNTIDILDLVFNNSFNRGLFVAHSLTNNVL